MKTFFFFFAIFLIKISATPHNIKSEGTERKDDSIKKVLKDIFCESKNETLIRDAIKCEDFMPQEMRTAIET